MFVVECLPSSSLTNISCSRIFSSYSTENMWLIWRIRYANIQPYRNFVLIIELSLNSLIHGIVAYLKLTHNEFNIRRGKFHMLGGSRPQYNWETESMMVAGWRNEVISVWISAQCVKVCSMITCLHCAIFFLCNIIIVQCGQSDSKTHCSHCHISIAFVFVYITHKY